MLSSGLFWEADVCGYERPMETERDVERLAVSARFVLRFLPARHCSYVLSIPCRGSAGAGGGVAETLAFLSSLHFLPL
jgi:hypothetical protein